MMGIGTGATGDALTGLFAGCGAAGATSDHEERSVALTAATGGAGRGSFAAREPSNVISRIGEGLGGGSGRGVGRGTTGEVAGSLGARPGEDGGRVSALPNGGIVFVGGGGAAKLDPKGAVGWVIAGGANGGGLPDGRTVALSPPGRVVGRGLGSGTCP